MKQKLLVIVWLAFAASQGLACPVYRIGKMYITDDFGKVISDAKVWQFRSLADSFQRDKYYYTNGEDTNAYFFSSSSYRRKRSPGARTIPFYFRIQAKGYADVMIEAIDFQPQGWDEDKLPILYIKMSPKRYAVKGDLMVLMNIYHVRGTLEIKDSLTVDFRDFMQELRNENVVAEAGKSTANLVRAFPNPVRDKLQIQINTTVNKPYKAVLTDIQGRLVLETQIASQWESIDMQWESKGMYMVQIYNPEGVLLYALKFLKS